MIVVLSLSQQRQNQSFKAREKLQILLLVEHNFFCNIICCRTSKKMVIQSTKVFPSTKKIKNDMNHRFLLLLALQHIPYIRSRRGPTDGCIKCSNECLI